MKIVFKSTLLVVALGLVACGTPKNKTEDSAPVDKPVQDEEEPQEAQVEIKVIDNGGADFPVLDLLPRENIVYYVAEESSTVYYSETDKEDAIQDLAAEETEEGWLIGDKSYTALTVDAMDETILWPWSGSNPTKLKDFSCTPITCIKGGAFYYDAVIAGKSLCASKKASTCKGKSGSIGAFRYATAGCTGPGTRVTLPGVICN